MIYIAYGSNFGIRQMNKRVPKAVPLGKAIYADHTLVFRGDENWGYFADVIPEKGTRVITYLYDMTEEDFELMDKYEQVADGRYYREKVRVIKQHPFGEVEGYIYKMREDDPDRYKIGVPSDEYIGRIARGYFDRGIPMEELRSILSNNAYETKT